jgi:hypothetical protein
MAPQPPQIDARWNNLPAFFVVRRLGIILLIGFAIPLVFALITAFKLSAITTTVAEQLVELLKPVWPMLPENYMGMRSLGRSIDANNYALFYLVMSAFALLLILITLIKYSNRSEQVNFLDVPDVAIILLGAVGYYVFSRNGRVNPHFAGFHELYPDQIGFFYFRTYILVASLYFMGLVLVVSAIRLLYGRPSKAV